MLHAVRQTWKDSDRFDREACTLFGDFSQSIHIFLSVARRRRRQFVVVALSCMQLSYNRGVFNKRSALDLLHGPMGLIVSRAHACRTSAALSKNRDPLHAHLPVWPVDGGRFTHMHNMLNYNGRPLVVPPYYFHLEAVLFCDHSYTVYPYPFCTRSSLLRLCAAVSLFNGNSHMMYT